MDARTLPRLRQMIRHAAEPTPSGPCSLAQAMRRQTMANELKNAADAILNGTVTGSPCVPGVVAMATDRRGNLYEGAAGKRVLGQDADMTTDSVFAIFSTTKAITGTAVLQLVEEGRLDLDAPAENYAPEIGKAQVLEGFDADGKPRLRAPKRAVTTRMLLLHTAGFGYDFFNGKRTWARCVVAGEYVEAVATLRLAPLEGGELLM